MFRAALTPAIAVLLAASPAALGASGQPDLTVTSVKPAQTLVAPGGTLKLTDTTRNAGKLRARASQTSYFLSTDKKKSKGDLSLGKRSVKKLAVRKSAKASKTVTVPGITPAGAYYVLACADARGKLKEKSEKNNCRASASRINVLALPGNSGTPGGSPQPAPTGPPPPAPTAPAAPTGLTATPGSTGNVALSWAAATGATGYRVFRGTATGGPYTQIATPTGTSYPDTGRSDFTRYFYVVQAVNDVGSSPDSAEASALGCVDSTSDSAGAASNMGSLSSGSLSEFSASICRGDQDWIQVTFSGSNATIRLSAGSIAPGEPGEAGHLQLVIYDAATGAGGPQTGSVESTSGSPQTASIGWGSGSKTYLMRVTGFDSTKANSYTVRATNTSP
jgi:hypothetical protein